MDLISEGVSQNDSANSGMEVEEIISSDDENQGKKPKAKFNSDKSKRRQRYTIANIACFTCRSTHKRCDSTQPICGRCGKFGLECVYADVRKKRGPAKRKTLVQLTREARGNAERSPEVDLSKSVLELENHLEHSYAFMASILAYETHSERFIFGGTSVSIPVRDYKLFKELTDPRQELLMNAILANGAQRLGFHSVARETLDRVRTLLFILSNDSSGYKAATHTLLSHYYFMSGDLEAANAENTAARQISELYSTKDEKTQDGINFPQLYLRCLIHSISISPTLNPVETLRGALKVAQEMKVENFHSYLVFGEIEILTNKALTCPLEALPQTMALLDKALSRTSGFVYQGAAVANRLFMKTTRANCAILLRSGQVERALEAADQAMKFVGELPSDYHDINAVASVFCAGQVFIRTGEIQKVLSVVELLSKMSDFVPIARRTLLRLYEIQDTLANLALSPDAIPFSSVWGWDLVEQQPHAVRQDDIRSPSSTTSDDELSSLTLLTQSQEAQITSDTTTTTVAPSQPLQAMYTDTTANNLIASGLDLSGIVGTGQLLSPSEWDELWLGASVLGDVSVTCGSSEFLGLSTTDLISDPFI